MSANNSPHDTDAQLETIGPSQALELYLQDKDQNGAQPPTLRSHESRLQFFVEWFEDETDYDCLRELSGLDIHQYKLWRFDNGDKDYSHHTVATQMDTLRVFIRFCASVDAVSSDLPEKIKSPNREGGQRSNEIEADTAKEILAYLDRYRYGSRLHATCVLFWYGMLRVGACRSIDLDDVDLQGGYIELSHDPEEDTPLKNGEKSERTISIRPQTCQILADYITENRIDVEDEYGRRPLFTTSHGRAALTTLRNDVYAITRPCVYTGECPHDRNEAECEAAKRKNDAYDCPSSESTHAWRRGSISWHLREETPKQVISDRADVSSKIIDRNYSTLTDEEKADVRSSQLPDGLDS